MNRAELQQLLVENHNPELLRQRGMVTQVWDDGEVTCQKSGPLLHMRSLHQFVPPHPDLAANPLVLPLAMYDHHCVCVSYEWYKNHVEPTLIERRPLS